MESPPHGPEPCASANSAISALAPVFNEQCYGTPFLCLCQALFPLRTAFNPLCTAPLPDQLPERGRSGRAEHRYRHRNRQKPVRSRDACVYENIDHDHVVDVDSVRQVEPGSDARERVRKPRHSRDQQKRGKERVRKSQVPACQVKDRGKRQKAPPEFREEWHDAFPVPRDKHSRAENPKVHRQQLQVKLVNGFRQQLFEGRLQQVRDDRNSRENEPPVNLFILDKPVKQYCDQVELD